MEQLSETIILRNALKEKKKNKKCIESSNIKLTGF